MTRLETAQWMAKGQKIKRNLPHPDLKKWEIFSKTFGFYKWKTKNVLTDEQLAAFKEGFEHVKEAE